MPGSLWSWRPGPHVGPREFVLGLGRPSRLSGLFLHFQNERLRPGDPAHAVTALYPSCLKNKLSKSSAFSSYMGEQYKF